MIDDKIVKMIMDINTKLDTIIAKAVTSETCELKRKPLEKFMYLVCGGYTIINIIILIIFK